MFSASDFSGVLALPPTPLLEGADLWDESSSIDFEETARLMDQMIRDGVSAIGLCGTTGECATLLWDEKRQLFATVMDVVAGRVPVFMGTTALGTREVVRQMKVARDLGAAGVLVGLPIWQTPTLDNAVGFYADLGEALPDLAVMVYSNRFMFKYDFPEEFWRGIVERAPTVTATKVGFPLTEAILELGAKRINFMSGEGTIGMIWRAMPTAVTAAWATSCAMGPEPWVVLTDAIAKDDRPTIEQALADIESVPLPVPNFDDFGKYNIQLEKARINAAGYCRCGPGRPPYRDLPPDWAAAAEQNGHAWAAMRARYVKSDQKGS